MDAVNVIAWIFIILFLIVAIVLIILSIIILMKQIEGSAIFGLIVGIIVFILVIVAIGFLINPAYSLRTLEDKVVLIRTS